MSVEYAKDAKFFQAVKSLTKRSGDDDSERRGRARRPFTHEQYLAPFTEGLMPPVSAFQAYQCHDLSTGGFSYYCDELPPHDSIVAAFGVAPNLTYLTAQIRYVKRVSRGSRTLFQVGCQFLGRIRD